MRFPFLDALKSRHFALFFRNRIDLPPVAHVEWNGFADDDDDDDDDDVVTDFHLPPRGLIEYKNLARKYPVLLRPNRSKGFKLQSMSQRYVTSTAGMSHICRFICSPIILSGPTLSKVLIHPRP